VQLFPRLLQTTEGTPAFSHLQNFVPDRNKQLLTVNTSSGLARWCPWAAHWHAGWAAWPSRTGAAARGVSSGSRAARTATDRSWGSCLHLIHKTPCHKVLVSTKTHWAKLRLNYTKFINMCMILIQKTSTISTKFPQIPVYVTQQLHLVSDLESALLFRLYYRNFTGLN